MSNTRKTGPQDVGGVIPSDLGKVQKIDTPKLWWERKIDALEVLLSSKPGLFNVHQLRRGIESLPEDVYDKISYYEKWTISMTKALLEAKVISITDLEQRVSAYPLTEEILYSVGDTVCIREQNFPTMWVQPHLRTPGYLFGKSGVIERICGVFDNPETAAFHIFKNKQPLYRVRFKQIDLWDGYQGHPADTIEVEVYQHWLVNPEEAKIALKEENVLFSSEEIDHSHQEQHEHEHEHDHVHEKRVVVEQTAVDREGEPSSIQQLAENLLSVLMEKGIITKEELRRQIEEIEMQGVEMRGSEIIAKAWVDPTFKDLLLKDSNEALKQLRISFDVKLVVVENTSHIHNVIVCTLCSCYPRPLLGLPPDWYKSRVYRSRVPREPRSVLREFGTEIPKEMEVRVHDSTADMRYIVLPQKPKGTDDWSEEQLRDVVNRDALIGVVRDIIV